MTPEIEEQPSADSTPAPVEREPEADPAPSEASAEISAGDDPEENAAEEESPWTDEDLSQITFALLFTASAPLSPRKLARLMDKSGALSDERVAAALELLAERLEASKLPVQLRAIAGGYQLLTKPEVADTVSELLSDTKIERLSPAALETLAVIAYRQPVTKAEIEAIRGVQAGPILRTLVDRNLIKVTGRADQPGSPLQYGTTSEFLNRFGLSGLKDLPRDPELLR